MKSLIGAKMQRYEEREIQQMLREEITRYKKEEHNMKNQIVKITALRALAAIAVVGLGLAPMGPAAYAKELPVGGRLRVFEVRAGVSGPARISVSDVQKIVRPRTPQQPVRPIPPPPRPSVRQIFPR